MIQYLFTYSTYLHTVHMLSYFTHSTYFTKFILHQKILHIVLILHQKILHIVLIYTYYLILQKNFTSTTTCSKCNTIL